MSSLLTRLKSLWKAITKPERVYHIYLKADKDVPHEVWDRLDKAFKKADEAFKEAEKAFDSLKKK